MPISLKCSEKGCLHPSFKASFCKKHYLKISMTKKEYEQYRKEEKKRKEQEWYRKYKEAKRVKELQQGYSRKSYLKRKEVSK